MADLRVVASPSKLARAAAPPSFAPLLVLYAVAALQSAAQLGLQSVLALITLRLYASRGLAPTTLTNAFIAAYLAAGVLGGFVADRFRATFLVNAVGAVLWPLGALLVVLWPASVGAFLGSLALTALGYGIINPTQVVFAQAQRPRSGRVVTYLYLAYNVGNLVGELGAPPLRASIGPHAALLAIFIAVSAASLLFLLATPCYNRREEEEEKTAEADDDSTTALLDDRPPPPTPIPLRTFLLILLPLPIFYAILYQQNTTFVLQANEMDRRLGSWDVPADLMAATEDLSLFALIPLFDRVLARLPLTRRMSLGMLAAALAMTAAAVLAATLERGRTHVAWQLPPLLLLGAAEALVAVAGLTLVVREARRRTRYASLATALWLALGAIGAALGAGSGALPWPPAAAYAAYAVAALAGALALLRAGPLDQ